MKKESYKCRMLIKKRKMIKKGTEKNKVVSRSVSIMKNLNLRS